jgi:hypothetical protein
MNHDKLEYTPGANDDLIAASGRSCGRCSLCCKLLAITPLEKPANKWCAHCHPGGGGCQIYATRPAPCRDFACGWLINKNLGDEWWPAQAKMLVRRDDNTIIIHVDPAVPNRWREAPYYQQIKAVANANLQPDDPAGRALTLVRIAPSRSFLILPDEDKDITHWSSDSAVLPDILVRKYPNGLFKAFRIGAV